MNNTTRHAKRSFPVEVKLSLRRFRRELMIPTFDLNLDPNVFAYLLNRNLIALDGGGKNAYVITPKGFNWDVDLETVRMPKDDEWIQDRDIDIDPDATSAEEEWNTNNPAS